MRCTFPQKHVQRLFDLLAFAGEFADVYKGKLKSDSGSEIVAVKILKVGRTIPLLFFSLFTLPENKFAFSITPRFRGSNLVNLL